MRYPFLIIALFASATLATLDAPAQRVPTPDPVQLVAFQPDKAPKEENRGRGHRPSTPEKKAALRLERARLHDHRMRHLVAASTPPAEYDVKDQGWAGDSGDQSSCGCMPGTDEVLTASGWQKWEDYDWSTPLGTMNQTTGALEFQMPLQKHIYDYDGPLYYSNNRCVDFALTPNHRMYVRKWDEAKRTLSDEYSFVPISEIGWYAGLPHATKGWVGLDFGSLRVGKREYSGDDFLALLSLFISDGWSGGSDSSWNMVGFCCFREDRIEMVRELAERVGLHEQPSRPGVWVYNDPDMAEWLRQNIYVGSQGASAKRIPRIVMDASQRQIEHFLKFFGDQHVQKDGTRRFYSSSRQLIDDLQELLLRIGKRGTIEERAPREAKFNGRAIKSNGPDLTLTERKTERLSLERKKSIRIEHYKGKVYCATVPNSTLVTRRNGSILISGNSCYLYSTVKTATSAFVQAGYGKVDVLRLSFQYGMDCHNFGGCGGGNGTEVIDWMVKNGWPAESYDDGTGTIKSDYPAYSARSQQCRLKSDAKKWFPKDWLFITSDQSDKPATVAEYKAALMTYGRVNVALDAGGQFGNYQSGVITSLGRNIDHEINVRGWSDAKQALLLENQWRGWGGAKAPGDNCAWLAYAAVGALQDPFVVSAVPLPPPPPPPPPVGVPVISSPVTALATINQPFTYQIIASNAPTAYAAAGLPDSLTCSATGLVSGVATLPGTFAVGLSATNAKGVGTASLALVVGTTPVPPGPVSQTSITIIGSAGMDGSYYLVPHALGNMRFIDVVMPKNGVEQPLVLPPLVPIDDRWKKQDDFNQSQTQFNREFLEALKDLKKSIKP